MSCLRVGEIGGYNRLQSKNYSKQFLENSTITNSAKSYELHAYLTFGLRGYITITSTLNQHKKQPIYIYSVIVLQLI
jgi:hypothetical protein